MFLKSMLTLFCLFSLLGCKQVYIVSNELSKSYLENREFFNDDYLDLKKDKTLFYLETGYFKNKEEKLIVFLSFDSLISGVTLNEVEIISGEKSVYSTQPIDAYKEKTITIDDRILYSGGARLEFNLNSRKDAAEKEFFLRIHFYDGEVAKSIDIKCHLNSERVWPT